MKNAIRQLAPGDPRKFVKPARRVEVQQRPHLFPPQRQEGDTEERENYPITINGPAPSELIPRNAIAPP